MGRRHRSTYLSPGLQTYLTYYTVSLFIVAVFMFYVGKDGRIILKWLLKKQYVRAWAEFICLRVRTSGGLL
jgi:hypothetical protein